MTATGSESSIGRAEAPGPDDPAARAVSDAGNAMDEKDPMDRTDATDLDPTEAPDAPVRLELVLLTVGAVLAGVVLRFATTSGLWLDEALSVNIAALPLGEIGSALRQDGHPPLYYYLLHVWMGVFGESDVAVRSLSAAFSIATLPLAYVAGRRQGGRALGLVALGLFAMTPFLIRYGSETRMYAMASFGVVVAYLLVDDLVRRGRTQWWRVVALALTVGALLWTHYWAMWPSAALGIVLLVAWRRAALDTTRRGAARALIGLVGGGIVFLPWIPTLLYQSAHTGTPWAGPLRPVAFIAITFTDIGGIGFADAQFVGVVIVVLVLLGVFGRAVSSRRIELDLHGTGPFRPEAVVVALTMLLGMLVTYVTWSAYATRYAAVFVPIIVLVAAAGVTRFVGRWWRAGVYAVTLGLLSMGGIFNITYQRTQTTDLAPYAEERLAAGDVVVTCPDQLGPATIRALPADLLVVGYPTLDRPDRIDWVDYSERPAVDPDEYAARVLDLAGPEHTVAMVWSSTYLTHEGTCEALLEAFARQRGAETVVSQNGSRYYESANLTLFPPNP